jgi:hypothetical protein
MKRVAVLFLAILILGLAPTLASAMGFMPAGLPSFGGLFGGPARCGDSYAPGLPAPTFYVGWGFGDKRTSWGVGAEGVGIIAITQINGRYDPKGVWLGVTIPLPLSERLSIIASGWYMIPGSSGDGFERYNDLSFVQREWSTRSEWWFADGLLAVSCGGGFSFLAGARYDYFTTNFRNPTINALLGSAGDTADLISYNVIPLVGLQVAANGATGSGLIRAVGIPTLAGRVTYDETIGIGRLEGSGNWNNGWFFELFGEATVKAFTGNSSIGGFVRWNWAHGNANLDVDLGAAGLGFVGNDTYHLGFHRSNITVGGSFKLDFSMPYL